MGVECLVAEPGRVTGGLMGPEIAETRKCNFSVLVSDVSEQRLRGISSVAVGAPPVSCPRPTRPHVHVACACACDMYMTCCACACCWWVSGRVGERQSLSVASRYGCEQHNPVSSTVPEMSRCIDTIGVRM